MGDAEVPCPISLSVDASALGPSRRTLRASFCGVGTTLSVACDRSQATVLGQAGQVGAEQEEE